MSVPQPTGPTGPTADADVVSLPPRRTMRLKQLSDVSRKAPADGEALVYDQTTAQWEPQLIDPTPAPNSITDAMIGDRTVTDTVTPSGTGLLTPLLSSLATLIKQVTGKSSWLTAPAISLEALSSHKARHAVGGADALSPTDIGASASNHSHAPATTTSSGFLSATDKTLLDSLPPLSGTSPTTLTVGGAAAVGTSTSAPHRDHVHGMPNLATAAAHGFMDKADKARFDALALAEPTQLRPTSNVTIGSTNTTIPNWSRSATAYGWHLVHVTGIVGADSSLIASGGDPVGILTILQINGATFRTYRDPLAPGQYITVDHLFIVPVTALPTTITVVLRTIPTPTAGSVSLESGEAYMTVMPWSIP